MHKYEIRDDFLSFIIILSSVSQSRFKYRHLYFIAVIYYESIYTYFIKICSVVLALQWYL